MAKDNWHSVSVTEALSDVDPHLGKVGHTFTSPKRIAWLRYCLRCGHVALKNRISQLVTRLGCNYENDARYREWRRNPRLFQD